MLKKKKKTQQNPTTLRSCTLPLLSRVTETCIGAAAAFVVPVGVGVGPAGDTNTDLVGIS